MRFMKISMALLLVMLLAVNTVSAGPSPAAAAFLQKNVVDFLTNVPEYRQHTVSYTICSNQQTGVVSYTTENAIQYNMDYDRNAGTLTGDAIQYWSDRAYTLKLNKYPFDPNKVDKVHLTLNVKDGSGSLTLLSWGNAVVPITFIATDAATMSLIGLCDDKTHPRVEVISFQEADNPSP